jgi:hypothetical protein
MPKASARIGVGYLNELLDRVDAITDHMGWVSSRRRHQLAIDDQ